MMHEHGSIEHEANRTSLAVVAILVLIANIVAWVFVLLGGQSC